MKTKYSRKKARRGAAAVEFALVVPFFLMLLFGIVEFGRAMMVQQMMVNATREGARVAVLPGSTTADVRSAVVDALAVTGVPCEDDDITVTPDPSTAYNNAQISVSVAIPFSDVSWIAGTYITADLNAATSMRSERFD